MSRFVLFFYLLLERLTNLQGVRGRRLLASPHNVLKRAHIYDKGGGYLTFDWLKL